ncbi:MAG: PEP-CTERM sorting domain-containing protein [Rubrivivax sp.]|nr:MAG: PEP-CTERM sorting domain-containing protein [Rubrivivax sp.]
MLLRHKTALVAALIAGCQLAAADSAEVRISNLSFSAGTVWAYVPLDVDWVAPSASTQSALLNPGLADQSVGWHGRALNSSVMDSLDSAQAQITAKTPNTDMNGVTASAMVDVSGGQAGWAFAKIFDGQILVAAGGTVTVSFMLDSLHASGHQAQANASIELCSTDFTTDTCDAANYVEAFVDATSPAYSGPSMLTASWTNPSATENTWAKMRIGLTASADSVSVSAVPEPASMALWLAGLAGVGLGARCRSRHGNRND